VPLTPSQLATLNTAIQNDPVLNAIPNTENGAQEIASAFNQLASPDFWVWRPFTSVDDILDQIVWGAFTPLDAPDGTAAWTNRSLACQGKQFNLQNLVLGRGQLATGRANIRSGLQDSTTNLPAGLGGNVQSAGWVNIRNAIMRRATRAERLLATGTGSTGSPGSIAEDITVTRDDILNARNA
jgi:hypothetical protein